MPGANGFIVSAASREMGLLLRQLGFLSLPEGRISGADDRHEYISAPERFGGRKADCRDREPIHFQPERGADVETGRCETVQLVSHLNIWQWNWMPDGKLIIPQGGEVRLVNSAGGESVLLSDKQGAPNQSAPCGSKYIVYRKFERTGDASLNLWRADASGANPMQLTTREKRSVPDNVRRTESGFTTCRFQTIWL